ncbi:uncharacterized protein LOC118746899 isoform X1 [Rhagoletis pomonella]|uniref:uncharacterized protein LOC118746899 isoform X1 n=1 Tax=Rhagoletis pomonella TaxID=28610 RepID=UPI0017839C41|nr:uncharacterized protein LOC118746899 isoform X1 [Rhagoletis pomonella]
MRRIKFILLMVKLYISVNINYAKIEEINTSIYELIKRRARIMEVLILYKNVQVVMWEYIHLELSTKERTFAPHQNRGSTFWEVECQCSGDNNFRQNFRLNRSAFKKLCNFLDHLKRKETRFHNTICLEKRVAIALYALGSSAEYRSIANLFGVAKSTVCAALLEFCREVWKVLHPMYFNHFTLSRETIEDCVNGFEHIGFPQCMGALDLVDVAALDIEGGSVAPPDPDGSGDEHDGDGDSWGREGESGEIFVGDDDIESENEYFEFMYID